MPSSSRFLRLDSVCFSYRDSLAVLLDVSLDLHPGWTALIGENGAGKTTLLRILAGDLAPEEGRVTLSPPRALRCWCRQTAERCTPEIQHFAGATDRSSRRWLGRLQLDASSCERWETLSPGERRRFQIGAALAREPEILLLDEPSDHLDEQARTILIEALRHYEGIGVLVSHDRSLLAALATATARIRSARVEMRSCGFEEARVAWRLENEERRNTRQKLVREDRRLRKRLGNKRNDQRSADANIRTSKRAKGRRDSDTRTMAARNRSRAGAAKLGREVALLRDKRVRHAAELEEVRFDKQRGGRLELPFHPAAQESIAALVRETLGPEASPLVRDLSIDVRRETRAWIRGCNGAGKSTLLRALIAASRLPAERMLVLPQELPDESARELTSRVHALPADRRGELLRVVGALGADPERLLETELPSPGEARKLAIAFGLANAAAVAFLDEPTNHLDLPAIERLEEALGAYRGALVLVTHDEPFARACASEVWEIAAGELRRESL